MYKKILIFLSFHFIMVNGMMAQNDQKVIYDLNDCIRIAIQNNLDLKNSVLRAESSEINFNQAKNELFPSLNMHYNLGSNNGRNIDPFTNGFINEQLTFSNLGLTINAEIFNGLRKSGS